MHRDANIITVAMTGASGAAYALRLIEQLLTAQQDIYLLLTQPAQMVIHAETELRIPGSAKAQQKFFCDYYRVASNRLQVFALEQWSAPIASGSHKSRAMVVCPCTAGTLSNIAHGASRNLLERAADVMLKEQRKLILVLREAPLSAIHLRNMLSLAEMGVVIMPASPGFYFAAKSVQDLVDFIVAKILDQLQIPHTLQPIWGAPPMPEES